MGLVHYKRNNNYCRLQKGLELISRDKCNDRVFIRNAYEMEGYPIGHYNHRNLSYEAKVCRTQVNLFENLLTKITFIPKFGSLNLTSILY